MDLLILIHFVPKIAVGTVPRSHYSATLRMKMILIRFIIIFVIISTGDLRATTFLRQRISVAIQRGNAASVLGTQRHLMST